MNHCPETGNTNIQAKLVYFKNEELAGKSGTLEQK